MGCNNSHPSTRPNRQVSAPESDSTEAVAALPVELSHREYHALQIPPWIDKSSKWTRQKLDSERIAFFETRVTGLPEVWQALQELLKTYWVAAREDYDSQGRQPTKDSDDAVRPGHALSQVRSATASTMDVAHDEDTISCTNHGPRATQVIEDMQEVLRAMEMTIPTGLLKDGIYDPRGNLYELPRWVICDPENLPLDDPSPEAANGSLYSHESNEAGSGMDDLREMLLTVRLNDGHDVQIKVYQTASPRQLQAKVLDTVKDRAPHHIRLFVKGKEITGSGHQTLSDFGWLDGDVLTAMLL